MNSSPIPCTGLVLTRNNAPTLHACLESMEDLAEVIVQDGFSTDATREIARSFPNARLMDQDKRFLDANGRITDFGAMRTEGLKHARFPWVLQVDSDESVSEELLSEVRRVIAAGHPDAFRIERQFVLRGKRIVHCSAYPVLQVRFFHKSLVNRYVKSVHERPDLSSGIRPKRLPGALLAILPPASQLKPKYDYYLALEADRLGRISWGRWVRWILLRNLRSALGLSIKILGLRLLPVRGKRLPLRYEWQLVAHSFKTIGATFPGRRKK